MSYISVKIGRQFQRFLEPKPLELLFQKVLAAAGAPESGTAGLVIVDDKQMRSLNRRYRGLNRSTDVLAFSLLEEGGCPDFVLPQDGAAHLGEIIISYPKAARQAAELGHHVDKEIAALLVHGTLHLLGYDHTRTANRNKMRAKQEAVLKEVYPEFK